MEEWINTFNAYFFLTTAGILAGSFHLTLKYCWRNNNNSNGCVSRNESGSIV